jgi:c-di-GMP-binding flagellar brake protein YcgR
MLSKFVTLGDKLELETVGQHQEEQDQAVRARKLYKSQVYDIVSEDQIKIAMPMEQGKVILLPVDGEYNLCFYTKTGLYQCLARVLDRYKSNNIFILLMELTTDIRKYQRREYYRLNCVLDMRCRRLSEDELPKIMEKVQFIDTDITLNNGIIVDISGGGARFISAEQYPVETLILFILNLYVNGEIMEYKLVGQVLLTEELANRQGEYEHRIQFTNIMNDDREGIIRYIFEEERKNRRREKG